MATTLHFTQAARRGVNTSCLCRDCKDVLRNYDHYFDDCERANKKPLTFDQWCITELKD